MGKREEGFCLDAELLRVLTEKRKTPIDGLRPTWGTHPSMMTGEPQQSVEGRGQPS